MASEKAKQADDEESRWIAIHRMRQVAKLVDG
jgi:3-methyladenine DNA glycosylase AlkC